MDTLFNTEFCQKLSDILQKRFTVHLKDEGFLVSGKVENDTLLTQLILSNKDRSFYYVMEGAFDFKQNPPLTPMKARDMVMDLLDQYLIEYFESGREVNLHLDWKEYTVESYTMYLKGQVKNMLAEEMADKLLNGSS